MTVYTDGVHLITDADSFDELHDIARRIGLRRAWFQRDHYDLTTPPAAVRAVQAGAVLIDVMDLARVSIRARARARGDNDRLERFARHYGADWRPAPLDPSLVTSKNVELMRRFAGNRRIGRRGVYHLQGEGS